MVCKRKDDQLCVHSLLSINVISFNENAVNLLYRDIVGWHGFINALHLRHCCRKWIDYWWMNFLICIKKTFFYYWLVRIFQGLHKTRPTATWITNCSLNDWEHPLKVKINIFRVCHATLHLFIVFFTFIIASKKISKDFTFEYISSFFRDYRYHHCMLAKKNSCWCQIFRFALLPPNNISIKEYNLYREHEFRNVK